MIDVAQHQVDQDFSRAQRRAWWNGLTRRLRGLPTRLLPLHDVVSRLHMNGQHDLGIQSVPLDQIVGSEGRAGEFDRLFLPRSPAVRARWQSIARARFASRSLPPVELVKTGDIYFVRDGNHRLSVARQLGQQEIDAHVVELETNVPLTPEFDLEDLERKAAQSDFIAQTDLLRIRPDFIVPAEASDPATYRELMRHFDDYERILSAERGSPVTRDEVIGHYFDNVYRPQIEAMRRRHALAAFPGRTETNLFLSIMNRRHQIAKETGRDPGPEAAVVEFMGRFGIWRADRKIKGRAGRRDWVAAWSRHLLDRFSRLFRHR